VIALSRWGFFWCAGLAAGKVLDGEEDVSSAVEHARLLG